MASLGELERAVHGAAVGRRRAGRGDRAARRAGRPRGRADHRAHRADPAGAEGLRRPRRRAAPPVLAPAPAARTTPPSSCTRCSASPPTGRPCWPGSSAASTPTRRGCCASCCAGRRRALTRPRRRAARHRGRRSPSWPRCWPGRCRPLLARARWPRRDPLVALVCWQAIGLAGGLSIIGALLVHGLAPWGHSLPEAGWSLAAPGSPAARPGARRPLGRADPGRGAGRRAARRAGALLGAHRPHPPAAPGAAGAGRPAVGGAARTPGCSTTRRRWRSASRAPGRCWCSPRAWSPSWTTASWPPSSRTSGRTCAEHHHLLLLPFVAWEAALPVLPAAARAHAAVRELVEMRADDVALTLAAGPDAAAHAGAGDRRGRRRWGSGAGGALAVTGGAVGARVGGCSNPRSRCRPCAVAALAGAALLLLLPTALLVAPALPEESAGCGRDGESPGPLGLRAGVRGGLRRPRTGRDPVGAALPASVDDAGPVGGSLRPASRMAAAPHRRRPAGLAPRGRGAARVQRADRIVLRAGRVGPRDAPPAAGPVVADPAPRGRTAVRPGSRREGPGVGARHERSSTTAAASERIVGARIKRAGCGCARTMSPDVDAPRTP